MQRRFASEQLGYPVWGMSPSSKPGTLRRRSEYGVKPLGAIGYGVGAVTTAALAVAVDPERALTNLQALAAHYPVYEWGSSTRSIPPPARSRPPTSRSTKR
ncbi:MAG: hypothetical protein U0610_31115 [bacterium]